MVYNVRDIITICLIIKVKKMKELNSLEIELVAGGYAKGLIDSVAGGTLSTLLGAANGAWSGARVAASGTSNAVVSGTDLIGIGAAVGGLWTGLSALVGVGAGAIAGGVGGLASGLLGGVEDSAALSKQLHTNLST